MKRTQVAPALLAATVSAALLLGGGAAAQASPLAAALCVSDAANDDTRDFYEAPQYPASDFERFGEEIDEYGDWVLQRGIDRMRDAFGSSADVPPALAHYLDVELPAAYAALRAGTAAFRDHIAAGQPVGAEWLEELLIVDYDFKLAVFNGFAAAAHADDLFALMPPSAPSSDFAELARAITDIVASTPKAGSDGSYQQLGDRAADGAEFDAVYGEIADAYAAAGLTPDEVERRTYESMRASVIDWILRVDLDYIVAYQAQVRQYRDTARETGYVFDEAGNELTLDRGRPGTRQLEYWDLRHDVARAFALDTRFLEITLTADGTEFVSPREAYDTPEFQELVGYALDWLNSLAESGDFSRASVVYAVERAVGTQYGMLSTPGSSSQPVAVALPEYIDHYLMDFAETFDALADPALVPLPSWKDDPEVPGRLPYDRFRMKNYLDVPFTVFARHGSHTVTRDIEYAFENGAEAAPAVTQPAEFSCVEDAMSGEIEWRPDGGSAVLPAVPHPDVTFGAPNATVLTPAERVSELAVTPGSPDSRVRVVFPLEFSVEVRFEDGDGTSVRDPKTLTGRWDTGYTAEAERLSGYALASEAQSVRGTFGSGPSEIVFVYRADTTGGGTGPGTGGSAGAIGLSATGSTPLIGAAIAAVIALLAGAGLLVLRHRGRVDGATTGPIATAPAEAAPAEAAQAAESDTDRSGVDQGDAGSEGDVRG